MKLFGAILLAMFIPLAVPQAEEEKSIWDLFKLTIDSPAEVAEKLEMVFVPDLHNAVFFGLKDLPFLLTHPAFDVSKQTVIYFHGWMESGKLDLSALAIRGAYLARGDHNIISVDWRKYSKNIDYRSRVIPQMKIIAESFAEYLREFCNEGYNISNLHLVGHSLGGQMVGKIGRHLKKITNGRMVIPRIYALDPAGPGFEDRFIEGMEPISKADADYVQIIHTCAGQLGMQTRVGHVDFYPNGGSTHPGCDADATASSIGMYRLCDHARSWQFFQESVRDPKRFPATRCVSWDDFIGNSNGSCFPKDTNYMGFGADTSVTGKYFLQTNGNLLNLGRGKLGQTWMKTNLTRLLVPTNNYSPLPIPDDVQESVIY